MANERIKTTAKEKKVRLWEVADHLGIQDSALSRKLRRELPANEQKNILDVIGKIAAMREGI